MFTTIFGKSWQSSVAGLIAAVAIVVGEAYQRKIENPNLPPITFHSVLPAIAVAVLSRLHKQPAEQQSIDDSRAKRDAHITADVVGQKIADAVENVEVSKAVVDLAEKVDAAKLEKKVPDAR